MDEKPPENKDSVSVKEIENFAKKHRFELFFCLAFVFACFFSFVFFGPAASLFLATIGAVAGVLLPNKVDHFNHVVLHFIFKQETTVQLVLAAVALVLAVVVPPVVFFIIGLHGGKNMHHQVMNLHHHQ